jgi:glycogen debranching enzyme
MARPWHMMALASLLALAPAARPAAAPDPPLHFAATSGAIQDYFLRDGEVAAHLLLRSGRDPRILVAFPAGNSGVGLWFQRRSTPVQWTLESSPVAARSRDEAGRPLLGIAFAVASAGPALSPQQAVLSSVRVLRDYQANGAVPAEVAIRPSVSGRTLRWSRDRLDGAPGYRLLVEVLDGALAPDGSISAGADRRIRLRVTAQSGERPLTAIAAPALLNGREAHDPAAERVLAFLSYEQKFLAGSWRFDTYFGRDTLLSLQMLMPVLRPDAIEAGLRSVLERLAPDGEVAHEEAIGEFAILEHKRQDGTLSDAPIYDYGMIDGNYLLAPVIAAYLLDSPAGRRRARDFLARRLTVDGRDETEAGAALLRNLRLVASNARAFASDPRYAQLLALKSGRTTGEWRDSADGLGGGRYPYDVNAILMPAALAATARLVRSGLLDTVLSAADRAGLAHAGADAEVWRRVAPNLFTVTLDNAAAKVAVSAYAHELKVPAAAALASLGASAVSFHALALDGAGRAVPVVNSDEGFELLFGSPDPAMLDRAVQNVIRPFPLGLFTAVGMVVANPVFAGADLQARFTNHAYHGTVVWSWQQALFAIGLERQVQRADLPRPVRERLLRAQQSLWRAIRATESLRAAELWSWSFQADRYQVASFGSSAEDADEANAAQLWSTVYLAAKEP